MYQTVFSRVHLPEKVTIVHSEKLLQYNENGSSCDLRQELWEFSNSVIFIESLLSEAGLVLSVQDMIIQNTRPVPSMNSNLGRIRKASNRCGVIQAVAEFLTQNFLSTTHSLENQVKVFTPYSRHFKKIATTYLSAVISAEIATTATFNYTRTHAPGRAATIDSTVLWRCITFRHLLCLVKLLPIAHSSRPCPVSPIILPCVTVCGPQCSQYSRSSP